MVSDEGDSSAMDCAIKSYSVGETTMYFNVHSDPALKLLCVTFVSNALSEEIGRYGLLQSIV